MDRNVIKELPIGTYTFRIKKFDASTGSWLLMSLMGEMQKAISDLPTSTGDAEQAPSASSEESAAIGAIQFLLMNLDEEKFAKVQNKALAVCDEQKVFDNGKEAWLPVLTGTRISSPDLQTDISTILSLTSQSLFANLSPFFSKSGLSSVFSLQQDTQE